MQCRFIISKTFVTPREVIVRKYLNNNQTRSRYTKGVGPPEASFSKSCRLILNAATAALLEGVEKVTVEYDADCLAFYLSDKKVENVRQYTLAPMYGSSGKIISMAGLRQEIGYAKAAEFAGKYTVAQLEVTEAVVVTLRLLKVGQEQGED